MSLNVNPGETLEEFVERAKTYYADCMAAAVAVVETAAEAATAMEQALPGEHFEQAPLTVTTDRIDRENGILRRVHIMGVRSRHGYDYALEAHRANASRYEGMAVGIDHDYTLGPLTVDDTWGTIRGPITVDAEGTWGDLHFNRKHTRTEQLLENIERGIGNVGLSAVTQELVQRGKTMVSFKPVRLDVVIGAATTKSMFEQAPASAPSEVDTLKTELAAVKRELADVRTRQTKYEQFVDPRSNLKETIAKTTEGIDLTKFWRDK